MKKQIIFTAIALVGVSLSVLRAEGDGCPKIDVMPEGAKLETRQVLRTAQDDVIPAYEKNLKDKFGTNICVDKVDWNSFKDQAAADKFHEEGLDRVWSALSSIGDQDKEAKSAIVSGIKHIALVNAPASAKKVTVEKGVLTVKEPFADEKNRYSEDDLIKLIKSCL